LAIKICLKDVEVVAEPGRVTSHVSGATACSLPANHPPAGHDVVTGEADEDAGAVGAGGGVEAS
jgi:hypothetical protein